MSMEKLGAPESIRIEVVDFNAEMECLYGHNAKEVNQKELDYLESNTPAEPSDATCTCEIEYSSEEIAELYDQDPGYVSDRVMKRLPDGSTEGEAEYSRAYLQHGIHRNVINWQEDSKLGTRIVCDLQPGARVERWGSESGSYLADEGTPFKALLLPVSSDKLNHAIYEVIQPFSVTESVIAQQPFDDPAENKDRYRQYKR